MLFDNILPIALHIINIILWGAFIFLISIGFRFIHRKVKK